MKQLLVGLLLLVALASPASSKPKGPKLGEARLIVAPRFCMAPIGRGCVVRVRVEIERPTPEFFCPSVEITIYGKPACNALQAMETRGACDPSDEGMPTFHKKAESDCEPWRNTELVTVTEDGGSYTPSSWNVPFSWPYSEAYRIVMGQGEWTVAVEIKQGEKRVTRRDNVTVN